MNISLDNATVATLKQSYKFTWKTDTLPYLGINLTPSWNTLYSQNYPALFKNLGADFSRFSIHPPSWFGRLHSVKMNVLPRMLYLFGTLPVTVAKLDLKSFQTKQLLFIWGNKRPRVNMRTLRTPRSKGGLGFPGLLKYYYAAQLAHITRFHSSRPHPIRMQIEAEACKTHSISSILWLSLKQRPPILCPALSISLSIWDRLLKSHKFQSSHTPLAPILGNAGFARASLPDRLRGGQTRAY